MKTRPGWEALVHFSIGIDGFPIKHAYQTEGRYGIMGGSSGWIVVHAEDGMPLSDTAPVYKSKEKAMDQADKLALIADAADAEDLIPYHELEAYADETRS